MSRVIIIFAMLMFSLLPITAEEDKTEFVVLADSLGTLQLNPLYAVTKNESQLFTAIYEGLTAYEPQYNLIADSAIAESWEIDDAKLVYTFTLRADARYSNNEKILASHIRDTWLRIIELDQKAPFSSFLDVIDNATDYAKGRVEASEVGLRAVSDTVLEVRLHQPASHFINLICHTSFVALHPSMLKTENLWLVNDIPSSGPYYIKEKTKDELLLEKNPYYWDADSVLIDNIKVILNSNKSPETLTEEINNGNIHWVLDLDGEINYSDIDNSASIVVAPAFTTTYIQFNIDQTPWNNTNVREALFLLIPWEKLRSPELWIQPAFSLVPPIRGYKQPKIHWQQDKEKALELLSQENYTSTNRLPPIKIPLPGASYPELEELLTEAWSDVTSKVDVERLSAGNYYELLYSGYGTIGMNSWVGDFADPLAFLYLWRSDNPLNSAKYNDKHFDKLLNTAAHQEESKRYDTLAEAEQYLLDSHVLIPLQHNISINIIDLERIGGWYPNPLDIHPFKHLRFTGSGVYTDVVQYSY